MNQYQLFNMDNNLDGMYRYRRKGGLIMRKLAEYIPVMIVTNISIMLINTVDKIVAGNFVGEEAMNAISIFYPVLLLTAVFSGPIASGIATSISNAMGKNDVEDIAHIKSVGLRLMILTAVVIGIVQIPIILWSIKSFGLSEELSGMIRQYAIGCMICTPLAIISTVGAYQLQIEGRMRVIMILTIVEAVFNLAFDLLFMGVFGMGVIGAGYGTACSNLIRCVCTVIYMSKFTDFYKGDGKRATARELWELISLGLPEMAFMLMLAFQNYFTLRVILSAFGEEGGVIYGLCAFCLSIVNVLIFGIQGGMRPLMGLYAGADDRQGLSELMRQGFVNITVYVGAAFAVMMLFPEFFYHLHGISEIPVGGVIAVRFYIAAFIIRGFDNILRLYLTNRKDIRFATVLTVLGNATLPLFALILSVMNIPSPCIFLAYLITELIIFALSFARYLQWKARDNREKTDDIVLYMTVRQNEAVEASRYIRKFADERGVNMRISYRVALCMEEMVAYIKEADAFTLIPSKKTNIDILIRFKGSDRATFIVLDDGAFIALDEDDNKKTLITDNYGLIKKMAESVEYQYILNLNYTVINFS